MRLSKIEVRDSTIRKVWDLLQARDKRKVILITGIQAISGLLDLLGIALIGVIGALAVTGFGANQSGSNVNQFLTVLRLSDQTLQVQVALIGCLAAFLLVFKTIFSIYFTRRILNYLSNKSAELSSQLIANAFEMPVLNLQNKQQQEIVFAVASAPTALMVGVLANLVSIVADSSLLILITIALIYVNPVVALFSIIIFTSLSFCVYRILHKRATTLGRLNTTLTVESVSKIMEVLDSYRYLSVLNQKEFLAREIGKSRFQLGKVVGENAFMPYISKYVMETAIVLGSLSLAASQFLLSDATHAVATMSIFLAAGSRIAPAALRIQQAALLAKNNLGVCEPAMGFIHELRNFSSETLPYSENAPNYDHGDFKPNIKVSHLRFAYPEESRPALDDISFEISEGSITSIVGPSGSGKSTLADLVLGIFEPERGSILISGMKPRSAIEKWPGAISYVPQEVKLIKGTIRENVSLGFTLESIDEKRIEQALEFSQLSKFVMSLPNGIDTQIGPAGATLSGGQKQRLGIARALITNPKLIFLDEATSALDGTTEAGISDALQLLRGRVTIVTIAHRLSTVANSDQVVYLSGGKVAGSGTFSEVRNVVPDFDAQASLLGL
jgi:ABC-type multidrug transport system fused ATPase/permease subunit